MSRQWSSSDVEWLAKRTMPVFALAAAGAGLVKVLAGPTWLVVALAAVAVGGPILDWLLKGRQRQLERREGREALWSEPPIAVKTAADDDAFYRLGVEREVREALDASGHPDRRHAPYVKRDIDDSELRPALRAAATQPV